MRDLPRGTVTFLFTDIEGSTRLLHELGDGYADALAEHRSALREAFTRHGGVEVDTQGDAFFFAFARASDAVGAASAGQGALEGGPIRVRMGVHTGEPTVTGEGYVGLDVHRGARIAAAAHGGQVVISRATEALLVSPQSLLDLGEHRVKDFGEPVRLFQVGTEPFPPLRTISNSNLPRPASSFVGRAQEVAEVAALVRGDARLVTLSGPGGSGKTRLAIEAAAELVPDFRAGVFWVGLATLRDPALVTATVGQVLGADDGLAEHVGERDLLLLLDNFEQVVDAAPDLSALLERCPNLRLLVTSRELLRIRGEVEFPVPPLASREAVELFSARSRLEPDGAIAELCRRLDDLPLAVELAAARTSVLSPAQILERLGQRLDLLEGGRDADPRQRTLRATIEWSHDLLAPDVQRLFARLAVFPGGCTLDAAEAVCAAGLDTLQSLVDKSLVRRTDERFWMLETIRELAVERLVESGEADTLRRASAEYLLAVAESANLTAESRKPGRPELVWPELDNLRHAIDWASDHDPELAFRLVVGLEEFWVVSDASEGARRVSALLERGPAVPRDLHARALRVCSETTYIAGHAESTPALLEQSLAEFEAIADERAITIGLHRLGVVALESRDTGRARALLEQSRARCELEPDPKLEADIVHKLGKVAWIDGNLEGALELFEESAVLLGTVGFSWMQAHALMDAAGVLHELGRTRAAGEPARAALRLAWEIGDRRTTVYVLAQLAGLAAAAGRAEQAGLLWGAVEAEQARRPIGGLERHHDELAAAVLVAAGPELEAARAHGRTLSLDEAVDGALAAAG